MYPKMYRAETVSILDRRLNFDTTYVYIKLARAPSIVLLQSRPCT